MKGRIFIEEPGAPQTLNRIPCFAIFLSCGVFPLQFSAWVGPPLQCFPVPFSMFPSSAFGGSMVGFHVSVVCPQGRLSAICLGVN